MKVRDEGGGMKVRVEVRVEAKWEGERWYQSPMEGNGWRGKEEG